MDLQNHLGVLGVDSKMLNADKIRILEEIKHKMGVEISKLREGGEKNSLDAMWGAMKGRREGQMGQPVVNSYTQQGKEISGN